MIDWPVKITICGLDELPQYCAAGVTHALSILDPEWPDPELFAVHPSCERLVLRFHDIIDPAPGLVAPTRAHMEAILAFGRLLPEREAHLVVHCHAGISRSTAAAAALLLQARPQADERDLVAFLVSSRPQAWPNPQMIMLADQLLQRGGRLTSAVAPLYRRQLEADRAIAEPKRASGVAVDGTA